MSKSTVVGSGTAASCTFSALSAAVAKGGAITFNCGSAPATIPITATMKLRTDINTVVDGGNLVTLDGQSSVQIFNFYVASSWDNATRVTLQNLTFINGYSKPPLSDLIPTRPLPCSQGYDDSDLGEANGGVIYMRDGSLTVINCIFKNNQAAQLGPDVGGGAIYLETSMYGALIVGSVFDGNNAANAGAVAGLQSSLAIYNSLFQNNTATGNGANSDDSSQCSYTNNGSQHEVGSGGNGGAIYQDGASIGYGPLTGTPLNITLCGDDIIDNMSGTGAFGSAVFQTDDGNPLTSLLTIQDSTVTGNTGDPTGDSWTVSDIGSKNLGSAFGVTAHNITVTNSTLQK